MELNPIIVPPTTGSTPKGLFILMHGWGANAQDLTSLTSLLNLPDYQFIFPEAPFPHPQVPLGRAWYALETSQHIGLTESRYALNHWLQSLEKITGIPPQRTILGGFSQGGAMTLDVGRNFPFAGLVVLSGYLHFQPSPQQMPISPILIVHGQLDQVVPLQAAQQARDQFQQLGASVNYHEIQMGHEIRPEVIQLIRSFVMEVMPKFP
ncbi:MAG: lipase family protein [Microcoleaceae cyanobacterium]